MHSVLHDKSDFIVVTFFVLWILFFSSKDLIKIVCFIHYAYNSHNKYFLASVVCYIAELSWSLGVPRSIARSVGNSRADCCFSDNRR